MEDETEIVIDLVDGDDPDDFECAVCGRDYDTREWDPVHGCGRCGVGIDSCPTEGCDGTATKYF